MRVRGSEDAGRESWGRDDVLGQPGFNVALKHLCWQAEALESKRDRELRRQVTTPSIDSLTMVWKQWSANALLASLYATQTIASNEPEIFTKSSNESLQWGPYKSNLYFGVRPRIPKSLSASLSWVRVEDFQKVQNNVRHTCEQHEGMAGYGWDSYDPRTGGVQTIHDKGNGIDLETSFVTISDGAWAARIKGTPREDAELMAGTQNGVDTIKTALWFNLGLEGLGSLEATGVEDAEEYGYQGDVVFEGQTNDLGEFTVTVTEPESNSHPDPIHPAGQAKPLDRTLVHSLQVPEEALWQVKRE
jgi:mannosyl-oligosaccharide glucosidase